MLTRTTGIPFLAAVFVAAGFTNAAQAALIDRGGGLIYDTVLNVTWLQDANYAQTSGYDADGAMTWSQATTWAANLSYYDSVRNVTYTDWRLPAVTDTGTPGCNFAYAGTDCGYNINTATGEMAHLFYDELHNKAYYNTAGVGPQAGWGLTNTGPFTHLQAYGYWSGTEYTPDTGLAWAFSFPDGYQGSGYKANPLYALAVRPGDVAAVPEPEAWGLMLSGLALIGAVARRRVQSEVSAE
jgi:hypothetical protein